MLYISFVKNYPGNQNIYQAAHDIAVPETFDAGHYHFLFRLIDKSGWQAIKGLSVKII